MGHNTALQAELFSPASARTTAGGAASSQGSWVVPRYFPSLGSFSTWQGIADLFSSRSVWPQIPVLPLVGNEMFPARVCSGQLIWSLRCESLSVPECLLVVAVWRWLVQFFLRLKIVQPWHSPVFLFLVSWFSNFLWGGRLYPSSSAEVLFLIFCPFGIASFLRSLEGNTSLLLLRSVLYCPIRV